MGCRSGDRAASAGPGRAPSIECEIYGRAKNRMTVPATDWSAGMQMTRGFFALLLAGTLGTGVRAAAAPNQRSAYDAVTIFLGPVSGHDGRQPVATGDLTATRSTN